MIETPSVWVVDDDQSIRWVLERALQKNSFEVKTFSSPIDLISTLRTRQPDVILSDIRMPEQDGFQLLTQIQEHHPAIPVVVMTAYSDLDSTVESFSKGAFEYLAKPFDLQDVIRTVKRAIEHKISVDEAAEEEQVQQYQTDRIVGHAPAMQEAYRAIARLSQSNATVLITGESGTGKELIAAALHRHSPRMNKPFLALNMAALPQELIEAELFGHERGAFTGASHSRTGRFQQADQGTLFLDEIGDMPISAQTRLLRVLSENSFYPLGARDTVKVDTRIIAATHQNLENLVAQGDFREDLYHRLNVIRIHVPPLRERRTDIAALTERFFKDAADQLVVEPKVLSTQALTYLESLPWPGNVRQLENTCHWLTVMAPTREILVTDLPPELNREEPQTESKGEWDSNLYYWALKKLDEDEGAILEEAVPIFEKSLISAALKKSGGKKTDAANLLGWGRNTFRRKLIKYHFD